MSAEKQRKRRVLSPPAPPGVRLVRKYGNRRLYDTRTSRYVTLGDLAVVFATDEDVKVVDAGTGEDLTKRVLAQAILFEETRRNTTILPVRLLRDLLRHHGAAGFGERKPARSAGRREPADSTGELDELKRRLRVLESQVARKR